MSERWPRRSTASCGPVATPSEPNRSRRTSRARCVTTTHQFHDPHCSKDRTPVPNDEHRQLVQLVKVLWAEPVHEHHMAYVELLDLYCDRLGPGEFTSSNAFSARHAHGHWSMNAASVVSSQSIAIQNGRTRSVGDRQQVLDAQVNDARSARTTPPGRRRLRPLRTLHGHDARRARVLHPQGDRLGVRDTGRKRPDLVYEWLLPHTARASGVTIREAVKPLSPAQQDAINASRVG